MIATPLFGLLVDGVGKRALFMMFGSILLMPVYLMMAYTNISLLGAGFVNGTGVLTDSGGDVAVGGLYRRSEGRLGTAYALMTLMPGGIRVLHPEPADRQGQ